MMNLLLESMEGVGVVDLLVKLATVDFLVEVAMVDHQVETLKEDMVYIPVEPMMYFQVEGSYCGFLGGRGSYGRSSGGS